MILDLLEKPVWEPPASEWYPLHPEYPKLDSEEQKASRINACRLFRTPEQFVTAWSFFTDYYLCRQPGDNRLPPGFFYKRRLPTPDLHFEMVRDMATYARNVEGCPRSSAKSVTIGQSAPLLLMLTRPFFNNLQVLSTDTQVQKRLDRLIYQVTRNPLILQDFGELKPKRGEGMWSRHAFQLENGAMCTGISVGGRMLGERPDLIILDDPEYDPDAPTGGLRDPKRLADQLEKLLFNVIEPMLDEGTEGEAGTVLFWLGTLLHRAAYIWYALNGKDERFDFWNRRRHQAGFENPVWDPNSEDPAKRQRFIHLLWPEKWSSEKLEELEKRHGKANFQASYMNDPTTEDALLFKLEDRHFYRSDVQPAAFLTSDPMRAPGNITYTQTIAPATGRRYTEEQTVPAAEHFGRMYRLLTVDYASTMSARSDYSAIVVMGFDKDNCLWVLDCWEGKVPSASLIIQMWRMALKWQVHVVGIEAIGIQNELVERATTDLPEISRQFARPPRPVPVRYPHNLEKGERIAGMQWRFDQFWVRFPREAQGLRIWNHLFHQINRFTVDLAMLDNDDLIDCLAMHMFVPGRSRGRAPTQVAPRVTPQSRILAGEAIDPESGLNYLHSMNASEWTPEMVEALQQARQDPDPDRDTYWLN